MTRSPTFLLIVALVFLIAGPAVAQSTGASPGMPCSTCALPPEPAMGRPINAAEVFASSYGQRLVDEFASVLRDSADPTCVAAAGSRGPTRDRAEQWLIRYGQRMIELERTSTSPSALDAAIDELEGLDSAARLRTFLQRPDMRALFYEARPLRLAGAANRVIAQLSRHLRVNRVILARQFDPIEMGDAMLIELAAILKPVHDKIDAAAARDSDFDHFTRIVVLLPLAETNMIGPYIPLVDSFTGIVTELREACLKTR